jgi:GAF domain-containing protein
MRWYVDLLSEGREPVATLVVEATSWQAALQSACQLRGESTSLDAITVELIPEGYRALNAETHAAYELRKAPDDAPLSQAGEPFADEDTFAPTSSELTETEESAAQIQTPTPGKGTPAPAPKAAAGAADAKGAEAARKGPPGVSTQTPPGVPKPGAGLSKTPAKGLAAPKGASAKAAEATPKAPATAVKQKDGAKATSEAAPAARTPGSARPPSAAPPPAAEAKPRPLPPALPTSKPAPASSPAPAAAPHEAVRIDPGQVLFSRGEDPSARSPLTYREVALCLPEGTAEPDAERILRHYLQTLVDQLAPAPPGKYVALAAFDVRFSGRPPKPPLVTLTWKDWRGPEPKVAYPAQQRALNASMAGVGMSMAGVFPSPFASLPGSMPAPAAHQSPAYPASSLPSAGQYEVLFSRGEDPSARSPLTYREVALCLPEGTIEADAERILRHYLQTLVDQLAPAPPGKYVALAAFDVRFSGRPPRPPLVTLTWKDWRGPEPKVAYPAQQRMLQGSMAGVGMSMAGVFPSPFASLPGNVPSPFNAMPGGGHTVPLPRAADVLNAGVRPASTPPPPANTARPGQGTARSPRDSKPSGGGGGGGSSEGWPPAAPPARPSEIPPSHAAGPAPPPRPALQPLPGASINAEEMPTTVAVSPLVSAEAWRDGPEPQISIASADSTDGHTAVSTGEFAIVDDPTPMFGVAAIGPEVFREDLKTTREQPLTAQRSSPRPSPVPKAAAGRAPAAPQKASQATSPRRHASASDLIAQLFEAMPGLQSLESEREGVEFLLNLLVQALPSRLVFCHVYDAGRREFVVAGARGPSPSVGGRLVGARTPESDPSLAPVLASQGAFVVSDAASDPLYRGGRWALAGEGLRSLLAVAVRSQERLLGLIELANPSDGAPFGEAEGRALEYAAEQFAGFLSRVGAGAAGGR